MTKVHGHITQLDVSGIISQMRIMGSIIQGGYVFAFEPAEAPTLLTAATVSDTQIDLGWTINSTRHIGHAIERTSVPGGLTGWGQIDIVLGAVDIYSDKTCIEGTLYYYRVRAYRYGIYSDYSNIDSDTTLYSFDYLAPSDLVATALSPTEIGLTWINNSVNAEGSSIERREEATAFAEIDTVLPDEEAFLDNTCIEGTKYYYRLRAFKGAEYSDYSNVANATTLTIPSGIAGLDLWIRADSIAGNDGDEIAAWVSKEGNSYSFAGAANQRPLLKLLYNGINLRPALRFDGTDDILRHAGSIFSSISGTIFAVVKLTSALKDYQTILGSSDEASAFLYITSFSAVHTVTLPYPSVFQKNNDTANWIRANTTKIVAALTKFLMLKSDGTIYSFSVNGVDQAKSSQGGTDNGDWFGDTTNRDNVTIGAAKANSEANFLKGDVAEIIVYNTNLSVGDIAKINIYLGNTYNYYLAFGDSIVDGTGASDAAHQWRNIVGVTKGLSIHNSGIPSTTLQNTVQNTVAVIGGAVTNNGRDTYIERIVNLYPHTVLILYGLNDIRLNDVAYTVDLFGTDLGEIIDGLITSGITAKNIVIGSPSFMTNYAGFGSAWNGGSAIKHATYVAKCAAVATAKGTKYINVYQWMADNGGAALLDADGVHPSNAGHAQIAAAFLSVL